MAEPKRHPDAPDATAENVTQWLCPASPGGESTHSMRFPVSGHVYCAYCRTRRARLVEMLRAHIEAENAALLAKAARP